METFSGIPSLWDLSQQPVSFSQLPDDDFLALLQKQFVTNDSHNYNNGFNSGSPDGVDPQSLTRFNLARDSPSSSDESSPSPPSGNTDAGSRRQSAAYSHGSNGTPVDLQGHDLKRKASEEDVEEGPSRKNAHGDKKGSSRRKSTGNPQHDETRLLKRKEQNRAAQRAFRERKEKHVKDLEEKVAGLEAKNVAALSENENLRDLLTRLQSENMQLKQAPFTFNVPNSGVNYPQAGPSTSALKSQPPPLYQALRDYAFNFAGPSRGPSSSSLSMGGIGADNIDFNSLTTFDPSALNSMDDSPGQQHTATDGAMQVDMGFGHNPDVRSPYKTIASNPLFMSFAEPTPEFDSSTSFNGRGNGNGSGNNYNMNSNNGNGARQQTFDFNAFLPWPGQSPSFQSPNGNGQEVQSLDELFGGSYLNSSGAVDFSALVNPSPPNSISPVSHANASASPSSISSNSTNQSAADNSNTSSCSSSPLTPLSTPGSGNGNGNSCSAKSGQCGTGTENCPKTRAQLSKHIEAQGASPFVTDAAGPVQPFPVIRKSPMADGEQMVVCKGSNIPKTVESDQNIEVLSAWRSITSNPKFKDIDINELCSEFTKKARCDGTKVVLEPQGVQCILENLQTKKH